ncbi:MAG TPA: hypothetical protein VIL09_16965 [Microvirga sp.]|jgi:hypothetical protein
MLILFLKSKAADDGEQMPVPEKLRLIFRARLKEAETEEDRRRAERELRKLEGSE